MAFTLRLLLYYYKFPLTLTEAPVTFSNHIIVAEFLVEGKNFLKWPSSHRMT